MNLRWNCTIIDPITLKVVGDVLLEKGTRESAFVHAISAAGVAYRSYYFSFKLSLDFLIIFRVHDALYKSKTFRKKD